MIKNEEKNRYKIYSRDRQALILTNAGLWIMLAFDIWFAVTLIWLGFSTWLFVFLIITVSLELLLILSLLPKPVLQINFKKSGWPFYVVFAIMPVLTLIWGIELSNLELGHYLLQAVLRFAVYVTSFWLFRFFKIYYQVALIFISALIVFAVVPQVSGDKLVTSARPVKYEYDASTDSYAVVKVFNGYTNNISICSVYNGKPVTAIRTGAVSNIYAPNLYIPSSIKKIENNAINTSKLHSIVFEDTNIDFGEYAIRGNNLKNITFLEGEELPQIVYKFDAENLMRFELPQKLFDDARKDTTFNLYMTADLKPTLKHGQNYIIYNCQYTRLGGEEIDGLYVDTVVDTVLPTGPADIGIDEDLYYFDGWYNKDYTTKYTSLQSGVNYELYAKYLKYYTLSLDENSGSLVSGTGNIGGGNAQRFHYETADMTLPQCEKDNFSFVGWFEADGIPLKGFNTTTVPKGSLGDKSYKAEYKKNYYHTYDLNGGTVNGGVTLPELHHEWSDVFTLPQMSKAGYTFMGWFTSADYTNSITYINPNFLADYYLFAKFNLNYDLTYNLNGGTTINVLPAYYHVETPTWYLPNVSKTGYIFDGWTENSNWIYEIATGTTGEKTLTANFTPITYNVYYSGGEGANGYIESSTFTYDAVNTLKNNSFTKTGYTFAGWRVNGTNYTEGDTGVNFTATNNATITATAQWAPITYSVVYEKGIGESGTMTNSTFTYDAANTLKPCTFTKTGYAFTGWQIDGTTYPAGASSVNFASIQDVTVTATAQWTPITYTINYAGGTGATGTVTSSTFTYDSSSNTLKANGFTKTGYIFTGWLISSNTYQPGVTNVNFALVQGVSVTATAQWTPITYTVNYDKGSGESGTMTSSTFTYDASNILKANEFTRTGYTFAGWRIGTTNYPAGATSANFATVQGATVTAIAQWTPITYSIVYDKGTGTGGTMTNSTFTYDVSNTLKANSFTKTGYAFTGWLIGGATYAAGATNVIFASTQGATVTATAQWSPVSYTVVYSGGAGASNTMTSSTFTYDAVNTLKENGFTKTGYTFAGWDIGGTTYAAGAVSVNLAQTQGATVTATAKWTPITYTVNYTGGEGATGSVTSSAFTYDASNTLKANGFTKQGYTFAGWDIGGTTYAAGAVSVNFAQTQGATVTATAKWTPITYTVNYTGGEGATGSVTSSVFTYDASNTLKANGFSKTGYTFAGWNIGGTTYSAGILFHNFTAVLGENITATAVWTLNAVLKQYINIIKKLRISVSVT